MNSMNRQLLAVSLTVMTSFGIYAKQSQADTCYVNNQSEWNNLASNCTDIDLQDNVIYGGITIDESKFPNAASDTVTVRNGVITQLPTETFSNIMQSGYSVDNPSIDDVLSSHSVYTYSNPNVSIPIRGVDWSLQNPETTDGLGAQTPTAADRSARKSCIVINRGNVELKDLLVVHCTAAAITIRSTNSRSYRSGTMLIEDVELGHTIEHGIDVGGHANGDSNMFRERVDIKKTKLKYIGHDGVAGNTDSSGKINIEQTHFSHIDQTAKYLIGQLNENVCTYNPYSPSTPTGGIDDWERGGGRTFMGDCVHIQQVKGEVTLTNNACIHTDMPTKNGFIVQNQNGSLAGKVTMRNNVIQMDNVCNRQVVGHRPLQSRDPNGVQIENIRTLELANNSIEDSWIGVSLNYVSNPPSCTIKNSDGITNNDQNISNQDKCNITAGALDDSNLGPAAAVAVNPADVCSPADFPANAGPTTWGWDESTRTSCHPDFNNSGNNNNGGDQYPLLVQQEGTPYVYFIDNADMSLMTGSIPAWCVEDLEELNVPKKSGKWND